MFVLDRLVTGGLRFVLDKVAAAVDAELDDEGVLREELLALQLRHELGEVDDQELAAREAELLARMRELREQEAATGAISLSGDDEVGVEVGFADHDEEREG